MTAMQPKFPSPTAVNALPRPASIDDAQGPAFDSLLKTHKLSPDEYALVRQILQRSPTLAELGAFSAMWSEHCSYKSSRVHLKRFPTEGPDVVVGPGENAGVVRISGKLCLAFKMESHNHPSYIEPYQGAATGVGGILRDVFCMGARPIANLNALRFGLRSHPRTEFLVENVVKGIGDYGNCVGIPTVAGNISFDECYNGNCLVNAMTVGVIHEDRIFKGFASGQDNIVVYLGSATGRDGIHGASMASGAFASKDAGARSAVQVGDPFTEKLLLEATLEVLDKGLVVGLQDMGAAGLTSSSFEMAGRAGNGLYLDLDQVPVRTTAMSAYELLLSESQERMLMVIEPGKWPALKLVLDKWQLASAVIGVVTNTGRVQIHHQGKLEVDVPVAEMTDQAPKYERPMRPRPLPTAPDAERFNERVAAAIHALSGEQLLRQMLSDTGSKAAIYRQYDQHIGTKTVHGPKDQGAAALWIRSDWADANEPYLGVLTATSCNERYCRVDPYLGAAHAVVKSARMLAAAGGEPVAVTDCLNYGNPEDPEVMAEFSQGVDGISLACRELSIPVVSGNVSLYNQTDGKSIAPTPMIGMVGKMHDVRRSVPAVLKAAATLYLLHPRGSIPTFGGSLAAKLLGESLTDGAVPPLNWAAEREAMAFLATMAAEGWLSAARDVGEGGIAATACKMLLAEREAGDPHGTVALTLDLSQADLATQAPERRYFGEVAGSYLIACTAEAARHLTQQAAKLSHSLCTPVGLATLNAGSTPQDEASAIRFGTWRLGLAPAMAAFENSVPLH